MKKLLTLTLILSASVCMAQTKPKADTTRYILTENEVMQISQLLSVGDNCAGNSTIMSTSDWKAYHNAVLKIDSTLRVQYMHHHPQPVTEGGKKP